MKDNYIEVTFLADVLSTPYAFDSTRRDILLDSECEGGRRCSQ